MQVLWLTKFFSKDDFLHWNWNVVKNKKESSSRFLMMTIKKPPEESRGLKYSHEKQKM